MIDSNARLPLLLSFVSVCRTLPIPDTTSIECNRVHEQCGGNQFERPSCCVQGFSCEVSPDHNSYCVPQFDTKDLGNDTENSLGPDSVFWNSRVRDTIQFNRNGDEQRASTNKSKTSVANRSNHLSATHPVTVGKKTTNSNNKPNLTPTTTSNQVTVQKTWIPTGWAKTPAYMHRFSFIECLNATTCFQRNTFLQPAWNGINFTAQKSSLTTGYGRFYIINEQGDGYHPFFLKNRQISFTVDVSNVPCMTDAALYVSSFDPVAKLADPGDFDYRASPPTGGYCDAQGFDGSACMEMDIFEGNSAATQVTTHTCSQRTCNSFDACDHAGCGVNSRHMPQIGPDGTVVSTRLAFKVLTRFELDNGTVGGDLVRIVQTLRQGNRIVQSAVLHDKACVPQFGGIPKVGTALGDTWLDGGTGNPRCSRIANQDVTVKFANIVISPLS